MTNFKILRSSDIKSTQGHSYQEIISHPDGWSLLETSEPVHSPSISKPLANLLRSAEIYPPARALALEEVNSAVKGASFCQEETLALLERNLNFHFQSQPQSGFILAKSLTDEDPDFLKNYYYWIVGRWTDPRLNSSSPMLLAVSSWNYQIYPKQKVAFLITEESEKTLPCANAFQEMIRSPQNCANALLKRLSKS